MTFFPLFLPPPVFPALTDAPLKVWCLYGHLRRPPVVAKRVHFSPLWFYFGFGLLSPSQEVEGWQAELPQTSKFEKKQRLTSLGPGGHSPGWDVPHRLSHVGQEQWLHQSPVPPASPLETQAELPERPGVFASGGRWGHRWIFNFLFAHSATQLHQLSMSHLVSKEMGSIPSFITVWTTVQANLVVGKQLWIRINLGQASLNCR